MKALRPALAAAAEELGTTHRIPVGRPGVKGPEQDRAAAQARRLARDRGLSVWARRVPGAIEVRFSRPAR